jgi:SnoaL-like domain
VNEERLSDLYAIQQLKSRYFRYLDTKAWDLWRSLFTDDMEFYMEDSALPKETTPSHTNGDEFVAFVSRTLSTSVTVHHGHMPDIEFTGPDEATGVWAMYDWVDDAEHGHSFQGWGHYYEKYRKGAGGAWQIAELRLTRLRTDAVEPSRPAGERPWPPPWVPAHA